MVIDKNELTEQYRLEIGYVYATPSGSGAGTQALADIYHGMDEVACHQLVYCKTIENLEARSNDKWTKTDDDLFSEFHSFVVHCIANTFPQDAILLWDDLKEELMHKKAELDRLGKRLHIGSPLYNIGLCHFLLGDFDTAYQYIAEAGIEDEHDGRGSRFEIMIGNHSVSHQIVIEPLDNWLDYHPDCKESYSLYSGSSLNDQELFIIVKELCKHPDNAIQSIAALHRFVKTYSGPENHVSKRTRMQSVGNLLISLEASLRLKHPSGSGQLHNRIEQLLTKHPNVQAGFLFAKGQFEGQFNHSARENSSSLNWLIHHVIALWSNHTDQQYRLGIAMFVIIRMRNNLLHTIDNTLLINDDRLMTAKILGMVLATQQFI